TGRNPHIAPGAPATRWPGPPRRLRTRPSTHGETLPATIHPRQCGAWRAPAHARFPPNAGVSFGATGRILSRTPCALQDAVLPLAVSSAPLLGGRPVLREGSRSGVLAELLAPARRPPLRSASAGSRAAPRWC